MAERPDRGDGAHVERVYASRVTGFEYALAGGLFLAADLLLASSALATLVTGAPSWSITLVEDVVVALIILAVFGALALLCLYYLLTPLPLLRLDATGLVYQPFPWKRRVVRWADLEGIGLLLPSAPHSGRARPQPNP
jgi:hypothetical protein